MGLPRVWVVGLFKYTEYVVISIVFAKVRFSKCTSLKIVPKAAFAVHFLKKGKNVLYRR